MVANTKIAMAIGSFILGRIAYKKFKEYREAVVPSIGNLEVVSDKEIDLDVSFLQDNKMKYAVDQIELISQGKVVATSVGTVPKGASSFKQRFATPLTKLPEDLDVQVKYNLLGFKPTNKYIANDTTRSKSYKCGCGCD